MNKTIKNVQILRFIAAFMVLFSHVLHEVDTRNFVDKTGYFSFVPVFWAGGVDIFFVISGFIMYRIGADKFGSAFAAKDFLVKRLARVVPPYWFYTSLMIVAAIVMKEHVARSALSISQIITSYLFIPWPNPYGSYRPVLILGWTLNFEMFFYAVFAISLFFRQRIGILIVVATLMFFGFVGMFFTVNIPVVKYWFDSIVLEFLFGMGLSYLYGKGVRVPTIVGVAMFLGAFGIMYLVKRLGFTEDHWNYRSIWMGLPALLACAGLALCEKDKPANFVEKIGVFMGNASYSLYLSHPFALNLVVIPFVALGVRNPWIYIVFTLFFCLAVSALAYEYFEKPLGRFMNRPVRRLLAPSGAAG